jgi:anti-sigma regulatory factor (Ser/Thr protein kinase)
MSRPRRAPKAPSPDDADGNHVRVHRFKMGSRREEIAPMVERVLAAAGAARLSRGQRENLAVAAAEALANAAVHGNRLRAEAPVDVEVTVRPGRSAAVEVRDTGPGFDAASVVDPTRPDRVLIPGGRGLYLMRQLVDEVEYRPPGNTVRLTVRRRGA